MGVIGVGETHITILSQIRCLHACVGRFHNEVSFKGCGLILQFHDHFKPHSLPPRRRKNHYSLSKPLAKCNAEQNCKWQLILKSVVISIMLGYINHPCASIQDVILLWWTCFSPILGLMMSNARTSCSSSAQQNPVYMSSAHSWRPAWLLTIQKLVCIMWERACSFSVQTDQTLTHSQGPLVCSPLRHSCS